MQDNGFFGSISGPFTANQEVISAIQQQCQIGQSHSVFYLSKIGIHYFGDFDLDLEGEVFPRIIVKINEIDFQIGKTRMLELQDVNITSIKFQSNVDDKIFIDYQYISE